MDNKIKATSKTQCLLDDFWIQNLNKFPVSSFIRIFGILKSFYCILNMFLELSCISENPSLCSTGQWKECEDDPLFSSNELTWFLRNKILLKESGLVLCQTLHTMSRKCRKSEKSDTAILFMIIILRILWKLLVDYRNSKIGI